MTQATCEHGLPPGCPLHAPMPARGDLRPLSPGRRVIVAVLAGLDLAVVALGVLWGWRLLRAAASIVTGQP